MPHFLRSSSPIALFLIEHSSVVRHKSSSISQLLAFLQSWCQYPYLPIISPCPTFELHSQDFQFIWFGNSAPTSNYCFCTVYYLSSGDLNFELSSNIEILFQQTPVAKLPFLLSLTSTERAAFILGTHFGYGTRRWSSPCYKQSLQISLLHVYPRSSRQPFTRPKPYSHTYLIYILDYHFPLFWAYRTILVLLHTFF